MAAALAGCIGSPEETPVETASAPKEPTIVRETIGETFEGQLSGAALPVVGSAAAFHEFKVPEGALELLATLTSSGLVSDLDVHAMPPGAADHAEAVYAAGGKIQVTNPKAGVWEFHVVPRMASVGATYKLEAAAVVERIVSEGEAAAASAGAAAGQFVREESEITVERQGDKWVAKKTVTLRNGVGVPLVESVLATYNGHVSANAQDEAGYRITASLWGRGDTEDQARAALAGVRVEHAEDVRGGALSLATRASGPNESGAHLESALPRGAEHRLDLATQNGHVEIASLACEHAKARTQNGHVTVAGATCGDLDLATQNGHVEIAYTPKASSRISAASTNGHISAVLPERETIGWDLTASNVNGGVSIALRDGTLVEDGKHKKRFVTNGFDGRGTKVVATLSTQNGDVDVTPA